MENLSKVSGRLFLIQGPVIVKSKQLQDTLQEVVNIVWNQQSCLQRVFHLHQPIWKEQTVQPPPTRDSHSPIRKLAIHNYRAIRWRFKWVLGRVSNTGFLCAGQSLSPSDRWIQKLSSRARVCQSASRLLLEHRFGSRDLQQQQQQQQVVNGFSSFLLPERPQKKTTTGEGHRRSLWSPRRRSGNVINFDRLLTVGTPVWGLSFFGEWVWTCSLELIWRKERSRETSSNDSNFLTHFELFLGLGWNVTKNSLGKERKLVQWRL